MRVTLAIGAISLTGLAVVAVAAVLIARAALTGTDSRDRAPVLRGVAEIVRAIRGRG